MNIDFRFASFFCNSFIIIRIWGVWEEKYCSCRHLIAFMVGILRCKTVYFPYFSFISLKWRVGKGRGNLSILLLTTSSTKLTCWCWCVLCSCRCARVIWNYLTFLACSSYSSGFRCSTFQAWSWLHNVNEWLHNAHRLFFGK